MRRGVPAFIAALTLLTLTPISASATSDAIWNYPNQSGNPTSVYFTAGAGSQAKVLEIRNTSSTETLTSVAFATINSDANNTLAITAGPQDSCGLGIQTAVSVLPGNACTLTLTWNGTGTLGSAIGVTYYYVSNGTPTPSTAWFSAMLQGSGGGGGGGGGAPTYLTDAAVTNLALSNDGSSLVITPSSSRPIVFCPTSVSDLNDCVLNAPVGSPNRYNYVYLPTGAISTFAFNSTVRTNTGSPSSIANGSYHIFIDNSVSNNMNVPMVGYGPLLVTIAGGQGSGGQAPTPALAFVPPALAADGLPTLTDTHVGATSKCVAPSFDVTPSAVDLVMAVDGVELKKASLTKAPFEVTAAVPAGSAGKTLMCTVTARVDKGSLTIAADAVIASSAPAAKPVTPAPSTPTTPVACSGTRVIGFGNAATSLSASGTRSAASFASGACKFTVTGYSQPSSSRASQLAAARAASVAAAIKAANPNAVVTVVNGGKTKNASCARVSNRCVVVSRG